MLVAEALALPDGMSPLVAVWNAAGGLVAFGALTWVRAALRTGRAQLSAKVDTLTGLPNTVAFVDTLEREVVRAQRYRRPFTVAYLDIDDFRWENDRIGSVAADRLLRAVADAIRRDLRSTDVVARSGGDEFAIFLPETGETVAYDVISRLRHAILDALRAAGSGLTVSIGAATFMLPPEDTEEMIRRAATLMYHAKADGKDGIRHAVLGGKPITMATKSVTPAPRRTTTTTQMTATPLQKGTA